MCIFNKKRNNMKKLNLLLLSVFNVCLQGTEKKNQNDDLFKTLVQQMLNSSGQQKINNNNNNNNNDIFSESLIAQLNPQGDNLNSINTNNNFKFDSTITNNGDLPSPLNPVNNNNNNIFSKSLVAPLNPQGDDLNNDSVHANPLVHALGSRLIVIKNDHVITVVSSEEDLIYPTEDSLGEKYSFQKEFEENLNGGSLNCKPFLNENEKIIAVGQKDNQIKMLTNRGIVLSVNSIFRSNQKDKTTNMGNIFVTFDENVAKKTLSKKNENSLDIRYGVFDQSGQKVSYAVEKTIIKTSLNVHNTPSTVYNFTEKIGKHNISDKFIVAESIDTPGKIFLFSNNAYMTFVLPESSPLCSFQSFEEPNPNKNPYKNTIFDFFYNVNGEFKHTQLKKPFGLSNSQGTNVNAIAVSSKILQSIKGTPFIFNYRSKNSLQDKNSIDFLLISDNDFCSMEYGVSFNDSNL